MDKDDNNKNKNISHNLNLAQEDAMILYNKFFSMQARRSMNLMDGLRLDLEESICREGGPSWDCFDLLRALLLFKMNQMHLPLFQKSNIYHKYLLELINCVQNFNFITDTQRPRKTSESDSITSVDSSRNTLLAVNTYNMRTSRSSITVGDTNNENWFFPNNKSYNKHFNNDSSSNNHIKNNPYTGQDSVLGQNKSKSDLKLGHVTKLGQYVSDYEPDPDSDKKTTGIFSKRHRKKEEEEEEEAVRRAEEILRDIQLITSHHGDSDGED